MPDRILNPDDDRRPVAGFFGKLPTTGDFVWRGLPDAFRKHWDFWLTRHIAPLERHGSGFPDRGLRFRLPSGGRLATGVIVPSKDITGRLFPLSLLLIADGDLAPGEIDLWCDAALALHPETLTPDTLWHALDALPTRPTDARATGQLQLWLAGDPPLTADPNDPGPAIQALIPV